MILRVFLLDLLTKFEFNFLLLDLSIEFLPPLVPVVGITKFLYARLA